MSVTKKIKPIVGMGATMNMFSVDIPVTIVSVKRTSVYVQEDTITSSMTSTEQKETIFAPNPKGSVMRFVKTKYGYYSDYGFRLILEERKYNIPITRLDLRYIRFLTSCCLNNYHNFISAKKKSK